MVRNTVQNYRSLHTPAHRVAFYRAVAHHLIGQVVSAVNSAGKSAVLRSSDKPFDNGQHR